MDSPDKEVNVEDEHRRHNDSEMKTFRPKVSTRCESFQPGSDQEGRRERTFVHPSLRTSTAPPPSSSIHLSFYNYVRFTFHSQGFLYCPFKIHFIQGGNAFGEDSHRFT